MEKYHHSLLPHSISIAEQMQGKPMSVKKESSSFHSALHSVQKPPVKPWKKPELHPQPPPPPKVYFVEPRGFRDLVQRLTGAPKRPLRETVQPPPPLKLAPPPPPPPPPLPTLRDSAAAAVEAEVSSNISKGLSSPGLSGFSSPSFYSNWCSFPLLSPASIYGDSRT